jgi:hypothetical protein
MTEEFSRTVCIADIPAAGWTFAFDATDDECRRLGVRFDVPAVLSVRTEGRITPGSGRREYALVATVTARVRQRCVVTLEPVEASVRAACERIYCLDRADPFDDDAVRDNDIHLADDSDDRREPLIGDVIDVGAAAAEEIALNLDPYPRADVVDESPSASVPGDGETPAAATPFSILGRLIGSNRGGG